MKTTTADTWFSRYIRLTYSQESQGTLFVRCATCGKLKETKYVDSGHYIKRQHMNTRFDQKNAGPQCKGCNNFEQGNPEEMAKWIDTIHGAGTSELLKVKSRQAGKLSQNVLKFISEEYKQKVNDLLKSRGWTKLKWW